MWLVDNRVGVRIEDLDDRIFFILLKRIDYIYYNRFFSKSYFEILFKLNFFNIILLSTFKLIFF